MNPILFIVVIVVGGRSTQQLPQIERSAITEYTKRIFFVSVVVFGKYSSDILTIPKINPKLTSGFMYVMLSH